MSTMVGTSRASRTSKDKSTVSQASQLTTNIKTERPQAKNQPTVEQIRMAQMIDSGKDAANMARVKQLSEMTGRSEEDVVVALHDAQDDPDRAVIILLEGEQGEWVEQGKKKKRSGSGKLDKDGVSSNVDGERGDERPDRSRDRQENDRPDNPPRRGGDRRNGGPPPRLARGRARDRNNFYGDRDRSNYRVDRRNFNGERESRDEDDWDSELTDSRERGGRGIGERSQIGERGRGRGRGGFGRRGGRGSRSQRYERHNESSDVPHIDTWTNETAENAEKENTGSWGENWGETWNEDIIEDQWTGSLEESKVFTSSQTKSPLDNDLSSPMNDTTSTIGQRLDVGSLFSKSAEFAKAPDFTKTNDTSTDSFISQYNQQATESIKNSIGIGSSARQNLSNLPTSQPPTHQPQPLSPLSSMPQREMGQTSLSVLSTSILPVSSAALQQQQNLQHQQQSLQQHQRQRPQRSKLPPPSKIPASAVEMPGHMMPQLDVQFGVDFGSDQAQFGFGSSGGGDNSAVASFTNVVSSNSSALVNHLGQTNKTAADVNRQPTIMSSPSAGSKPQQSASMTAIDASPQRATAYSKSVFTTPTKSESQSNKVSSEALSFPVSAGDPKSATLLNSQRSAQSPATLSQGSLSTSKADVAGISNFSATNGFTPNSYSSHKASSLSSVSSASQTFAHNSVSASASTYQSQYAGQNQYSAISSQGSQFPSGGQSQYTATPSQYAVSATGSSSQSQYLQSQTQFPNSQRDFPSSSNQSQYQNSSATQYGSYQSSSAFPAQSGLSSAGVSQANQNSLYPTSSQPSSTTFTSGTGSFHTRDSQSSSNLQQSSSQQNNNYQPQGTTNTTGLKAGNSQSSVNYNSQTYTSAQNLPPSPLGNKLGDNLSKMTLKDSSLEGRSSSQFDQASTSTTTSSLTSTTSTSSVSSVASTVSSTTTPMVPTTSSLISRVSATLPVTTKAPPNLPPGVPLINPQYIMSQAGTLPPFYGLQGLQGLQQPMYGFEDMQMLQQRLPLQTGSYYDMSAFSAIPTTLAGRDQTAMGATPYSGNTSDNKQINRMEAQSPNSASQQQSTPQQTLPFNFYYAGYHYPGAVLPGAAGFQYPTMFPAMPPVTNAPAPHVPTTGTTQQLPKTFASHQGYNLSKGTGSAAEINAGTYPKSHTQGFDKQGFPGGTPPPFSLPLASAGQAGPLGTPGAPYGATPFLPVIPPQAHNQTIMHHPLQQDAGAGSARGLQQPGNQGKSTATKPYGTYWSN